MRFDYRAYKAQFRAAAAARGIDPVQGATADQAAAVLVDLRRSLPRLRFTHVTESAPFDVHRFDGLSHDERMAALVEARAASGRFGSARDDYSPRDAAKPDWWDRASFWHKPGPARKFAFNGEHDMRLMGLYYCDLESDAIAAIRASCTNIDVIEPKMIADRAERWHFTAEMLLEVLVELRRETREAAPLRTLHQRRGVVLQFEVDRRGRASSLELPLASGERGS